jgi:hypothetical protein
VIREASLLPPFIPLRVQARWANGLLYGCMGVSWLAVGIGLSELRLLVRATSGRSVAPLERSAQFISNEWLLLGQGVLLAVTAVAFLTWLYQARVNVRALAVRRPSYSSNWAVLGFLVPLVNTFRPYQVVSEVWRASDPETLDPFTWKQRRVSRLVPLWWGLLASTVGVALLAWLTSVGAGVNLARLELTTALAIAANLLAGLAAGAATVLITRIGDAQETKYHRLLASEEEKPE